MKKSSDIILDSYVTESENVEKANLNLFDIFSLGFGGAIGSGIFVLMGQGIASTGRSIVLSIVVAVFFMLLANFFSVILSSMFKLKGGDYSQKAIVFNPLLTGVAGYANFSFGFSIAMYSIAVVQYSSIVMPGILPYSKIIGVAIITIFFLATIKGSKFISTLNSIMTVVLLISILFFIGFGVPQVREGFFTSANFFSGGLPGFVTAVALMSFACQGITQGPISVAAVAKKSVRNIPIAMGLVAIALAIVYGIISYVAAGVLPIEEVAGKNLSIVAAAIFPKWVFIIFLLGGAVFAILTSMVSMITMVRYPILKVAEDGWLPKVFTKTTNTGYPYIIYGVYYLISILPVLLGFSLDVIVSLIMIPLMIMNIYLNIACIKIIKEHPALWKNSIIHMPSWLINTICLAAATCSAIVCYNLFVGLASMEKILMIALLLIFFGLAYFNLKTKRVDIAHLERSKQAIIQDALSEE